MNALVTSKVIFIFSSFEYSVNTSPYFIASSAARRRFWRPQKQQAVICRSSASNIFSFFSTIVPTFAAFGATIDATVNKAILTAVFSAINAAFHTTVVSTIYTAICAAINPAVDAAILAAIIPAVGSAIDSAINPAVF
jgi:hypothetical protein